MWKWWQLGNFSISELKGLKPISSILDKNSNALPNCSTQFQTHNVVAGSQSQKNIKNLIFFKNVIINLIFASEN